jgi:hypothetical protein
MEETEVIVVINDNEESLKMTLMAILDLLKIKFYVKIDIIIVANIDPVQIKNKDLIDKIIDCLFNVVTKSKYLNVNNVYLHFGIYVNNNEHNLFNMYEHCLFNSIINYMLAQIILISVTKCINKIYVSSNIIVVIHCCQNYFFEKRYVNTIVFMYQNKNQNQDLYVNYFCEKNKDDKSTCCCCGNIKLISKTNNNSNIDNIVDGDHVHNFCQQCKIKRNIINKMFVIDGDFFYSSQIWSHDVSNMILYQVSCEKLHKQEILSIEKHFTLNKDKCIKQIICSGTTCYKQNGNNSDNKLSTYNKYIVNDTKYNYSCIIACGINHICGETLYINMTEITTNLLNLILYKLRIPSYIYFVPSFHNQINISFINGLKHKKNIKRLYLCDNRCELIDIKKNSHTSLSTDSLLFDVENIIKEILQLKLKYFTYCSPYGEHNVKYNDIIPDIIESPILNINLSSINIIEPIYLAHPDEIDDYLLTCKYGRIKYPHEIILMKNNNINNVNLCIDGIPRIVFKKFNDKHILDKY